jgi:hypothetical protein
VRSEFNAGRQERGSRRRQRPVLSASHRCGELFDAGCVERKNGMTCAIERHVPIVEHDPGVVDVGGDKVRSVPLSGRAR